MPTLRRWLVFLWAATFLAGVPLLAWAQPTTQVSTSRTGEPFRFRGWQSPADASVGARLLTSDEREFLDRLPVVRVGLALPAFQPYEVVADNGEISGIHVQILWQLARAFGIRLEPVVFNSFPAMLEAAQERKVDLLMSLGVNTERARFLEFTLGATPMVSAVFRRTAAQPTPPMELERGRYAIERSNIANDHVRRRYPDAGIMPVETRSEALRRVHGGDADFYIGNLLPTLDQMQRERITDIEVLQLAEYGTGYYHYAVRKDWAALARILNKGIGARATYSPPELDRALAALARPMPEQRRWQLPPEHWRTLMERPVWRVGAVRDLIALNEADSTGRHQGIAAEYTEAIARQLGVGIEVVPFASVADMLDAARAGQVDVVPLLTRTPAREQDFAFSRPYIELPYMIVGRRDGPLYWSLESLRGKRLALARQHPLRDLLAAR